MSIHAALTSLALLAAGASVDAQAQPAQARAQAPKTIRWVVAHDRGSERFTELLKTFAGRLSEKSGGALAVEFVHRKLPDHKIFKAAYKDVVDGSAEMSQLTVSEAGVEVLEYQHDPAHCGMVLVSRRPGAWHFGQSVRTQVSIAASGDSPVPVGL